MTTDKMLENLMMYAKRMDSTEYGIVMKIANGGCKSEIPELDAFGEVLFNLRDDIARKAEKAKGRDSALKGAKWILKSSQKLLSEKPAFTYAYTNKETNMQYVCNGRMLVRFKDPLKLPELPSDLIYMSDKNLENLLATPDKVKRVYLPDYVRLKTYIATQKAKLKAMDKKDKLVMYDFGEGSAIVNAEFLIVMMGIFPDVTNVYSTPTSIHFDNGSDKGILLGIRPENGTVRKETNINVM